MHRQFAPKQSTIEINFSLIEATADQVPTLSSHHHLDAIKTNDALEGKKVKQSQQNDSDSSNVENISR